MQHKTVVLVVGAGDGSRFSSDIPKQYLMLNGESIFARSINLFQGFDVLPIINKKHEALFLNRVYPYIKDINILPYVFGGSHRAQSVYNGLLSLAEYDYIMIHDAARPFANYKPVINAMEKGKKAVVLCSKIYNSIAKVENEHIAQYEDRKSIVHIETPQGFHLMDIKNAYAKNSENLALFTDDASIAISAGIKVKCVFGGNLNIKITVPEDITIAESILTLNQ